MASISEIRSQKLNIDGITHECRLRISTFSRDGKEHNVTLFVPEHEKGFSKGVLLLHTYEEKDVRGPLAHTSEPMSEEGARYLKRVIEECEDNLEINTHNLSTSDKEEAISSVNHGVIFASEHAVNGMIRLNEVRPSLSV
jgi:hypothetical protein